MQDFNYDLCERNEVLVRTGTKMPGAMKTGTTIVGITYEGGVVLGADTRATNGPMVADKNCEKIHYIADNIYCCGAGTAADTENTTDLISSKLRLHQMATGRQCRVSTACTMLKQMLWRYGGNISAALILGGVDIDGSHLYTIYPHGSVDKLPFVTMGSGSLAAMSIFESEYKDGLTKDDAIALVVKAVAAGVFNDLGSGSNIDVTIITRDSTEVRRNFVKPNERKQAPAVYYYPPGTTAVLSTKVVPIAKRKDIVVEEVEVMDVV